MTTEEERKCPFVVHYEGMEEGKFICCNHESEKYDDYVRFTCLKPCHPLYEQIMDELATQLVENELE